jgi:ATP synthase protein I
MPTPTQKFKPKKKQLNDYARYSAMGFQMALIIFLCTWGGVKLDEWLGLKKVPIFTLILSLSSVVLSLYYFLRGLSRNK